MSILKRIAHRLLRNWTYQMFPHLKQFQTVRQGMDSLVLGGYGTFDYYKDKYGTSESIADLTVAPMSISYMLRVFKNYHSYLKAKGKVVLVLHPYSLCIDHYNSTSTISKDIRFYPVLHNAMIEAYDSKLSIKWSRSLVPTSIKDLSLWIRMAFTHYSLKDEKNECLDVLNRNIGSNKTKSEKLINTIHKNVSILEELKEFAEERGYKVKVELMKDFIKGKSFDKYESVINDILDYPLMEANIKIWTHEDNK